MIVFIGTSLALMPLTFLAARNWRLLAGLVEFYFREKFELTGRTPRARVLPILIHIPVQLFFPNVLRQWKIIEEVVLPGDDAIVEKFKLSYLSDCSMTSVAGAIIAQVAITALSLPNLSQSHWVARALFVMSLISGCFSVYFSCHAQKSVRALYDHSVFKDWLTRRNSVPLSVWGIGKRLKQLEELEKIGPKSGTGFSLGDGVEKGLLEEFSHLKQWQRSSSLWSAFILQAPFWYMELSLSSFILGLGIYLGFVWTRDLEQSAGPNDSRNIFIFFIVVLVFYSHSYATPAFHKEIEVLTVKRWKDYQDKLGDFAARHGAVVTGHPTSLPCTPSIAGSDDITPAPGPTTIPKNTVGPSSKAPPIRSSPLGFDGAGTASLISALEASTSAQVATNREIRSLRDELRKAGKPGMMRLPTRSVST